MAIQAAGAPRAAGPPRVEQAGQAQRAAAAEAGVALKHGEKWLQYRGRGLAVAPQRMPPKLAARAAAAAAAQLAISPAGKPPSEWRAGDPQRTYSPPGRKRSPPRSGDGRAGAVYPSWWGDGEEWGSEEAGPGPRSRSAPRPGRRPPRLAYSVQLEPGQPLWQNDLVAARYLDVPSSGYGGAHSPPRVPPQYLPPPELAHPPPQAYGYPPSPGFQGPYGTGGDAAGPQLYVVHPSGALMPVAAPAQVPAGQRQQRQQQRGGEGGKPAWKPIRTGKVQSRIREQVEADKAAARARAAARQRAAEAAVAGGAGLHAHTTQRQERPSSAASAATPGRRPAAAAAATSPADIADSLTANPYTSWFFTGQEQGPRDPHEAEQEQDRLQQRVPAPAAGAAPETPTSAQQHQQPPSRAYDAPSNFATLHPAHPTLGMSTVGGPSPSTFLTGSDSGRRAAFSWLDGSPSGGTPQSTFRSSQQPSQHSPWLGSHPVATPPHGAEQRPSGSRYPSWLQDPFAHASPSHPASSHGSMRQGGADVGGAPSALERRQAWGEGPAAAAPPSSSWLAGPAWLPSWQQPAQQGLLPPQRPQQQQGAPSWLAGGASAAASSRGSELRLGAGGMGAGGFVAPPPPRLSPREEVLKAVRPEVVKLSKTWVGDFGHLQEPRFPPRRPTESENVPRASQPETEQHGGRRATAEEVEAAIQRLQQQRRESMNAQEPAVGSSQSVGTGMPAAAAAAAAANAAAKAAGESPPGMSGDNSDGFIAGAAARVMAAEREFDRVMGQVARLAAAVGPGREDVDGDNGVGAGSRLWNLDEIVGKPSHLTYQ